MTGVGLPPAEVFGGKGGVLTSVVACSAGICCWVCVFLVLDLVMVGEGIFVFGRCGLDAVEDFLGPRLSFLMVIIWVV